MDRIEIDEIEEKRDMGYFKRIVYLVLGTFLLAFGIVLTMKANIGFAPWDVFHWGVAKVTGTTVGFVSIVTGLIICVIVAILGEKLGLGTIVNMVTIGLYIDLLLYRDLIPEMHSFVPGLFMLITGLFVIAFATFLYISSAFGAGPRDSLMVALERVTKRPVGLCRGSIEVAVCLIGWILGGQVGVGTLISALGIGVCVQIVFSLLKFDATAVRHETLDETFKHLKAFAMKVIAKEN